MAKNCLIKIFLRTLKGQQMYFFGVISERLSVGNHGFVTNFADMINIQVKKYKMKTKLSNN